MKSIAFAFALLITIVTLFAVVFYGSIEIQTISSIFSHQTNTPSVMREPGKTDEPKTKSNKFIPSEFQGPANKPSVRGPSGPPPNY